jgi:hypothetical protein
MIRLQLEASFPSEEDTRKLIGNTHKILRILNRKYKVNKELKSVIINYSTLWTLTQFQLQLKTKSKMMTTQNNIKHNAIFQNQLKKEQKE